MLPLPPGLSPEAPVTIRKALWTKKIDFLVFSSSVVVAYSTEGEIVEHFTGRDDSTLTDVVLCGGTYAALTTTTTTTTATAVHHSRAITTMLMWESRAQDPEHFADTPYPLSRIARLLPLPSPALSFLLPADQHTPHHDRSSTVTAASYPFLLYQDGSLARIHSAGISAPFTPTPSTSRSSNNNNNNSSSSFSPVLGAASSTAAVVLYRDTAQDGVYSLAWTEDVPDHPDGMHTRLPLAEVILSPAPAPSSSSSSSSASSSSSLALDSESYRKSVDHDPVCMWMTTASISNPHATAQQEGHTAVSILWDTGYITRIHMPVHTAVLSFPATVLSFPHDTRDDHPQGTGAAGAAVMLRGQQYLCLIGPKGAGPSHDDAAGNDGGDNNYHNYNNNTNDNDNDITTVTACCWDTTYYTLQSTTEVWELDPAASIPSLSAASLSLGRRLVVSVGTAQSCRIIRPNLPNVSTALLLSSSTPSSETSSETSPVFPTHHHPSLPSWLHSGTRTGPTLQRMADRSDAKTEGQVQDLCRSLCRPGKGSSWTRHPMAAPVVSRILSDGMWDTLRELLDNTDTSLPVTDYGTLVSGIIDRRLISVFHQAIGRRRVTGIPEHQLVRLIPFLSDDNTVSQIYEYVQHSISNTEEKNSIHLMSEDHPIEVFLTFIINYPTGPSLFSALHAINKDHVTALFKYITKWIHRLHFQSLGDHYAPCPSMDALVAWASALCSAQLPTIVMYPDLAQHASNLKQLITDVENKERETAAVLGVMRSLVKHGIAKNKIRVSQQTHNITQLSFQD